LLVFSRVVECTEQQQSSSSSNISSGRPKAAASVALAQQGTWWQGRADGDSSSSLPQPVACLAGQRLSPRCQSAQQKTQVHVVFLPLPCCRVRCCSLLFACLQDGQLVTFSEVVGMTQLNSHKPVKVKNCKVGRGEEGGCTGAFDCTVRQPGAVCCCARSSGSHCSCTRAERGGARFCTGRPTMGVSSRAPAWD
jgi:hypothetical protein